MTLVMRAIPLLVGLSLGLGYVLSTDAPAAVATQSAGPADAVGSPTVVVHKSPTCGCCGSWEDHLREHGFEVDSQPTARMDQVKSELGVPDELGSCHTAVVDGYVIEGHVPADAIRRLLDERPDAKGLFVPGMPAGSPGMELPSGEVDPFDVLLLRDDGTSEVFEHVS